MRQFVRTILLAATMLTPGALMAQDAVDDSAQQSDDGVTQVNEIFVTARKTQERLQDAPLAVAVVTDEGIDRLGFNSVTDLTRATAGLVFDDSFGRDANRPVIRGQANILGDSGVAFFIDGIYFNGSIADYDIDSISRIEVVKGPQSALYGRNTYSGAINIISKSPADRWGGRVQADVAEGLTYDISGSLSGPLAPGLGLIVGGRHFKNEGLFTNQFDQTPIGVQETSSGFAMLKYDDGGALRVGLRGNYTRTRDGQPAIFATDANENNCLPDNGALYAGRGRYFCGVIQPRPVSSDYSRQFAGEFVGNAIDTWNAGLSIDVDLADNLTLTSLTGYNHREAVQRTDGDYSPNRFQGVIFATIPLGPPTAPSVPFGFASSQTDFSFSNASKREDWSQELRLQYTTDRARVLLGGFYWDQDSVSRDNRVLPPGAQAEANANMLAARQARCAITPRCGSLSPAFPLGTLAESRNSAIDNIRNMAVFGSISYNLTDALSISAEGRYQEERIRTLAQTATVAAGNIGAAVPGEATFREFLPRITVDYQLSPDHLLYGVYSEGQKPGGFNGAAAISVGRATFGAEDVKSYEVGSKNTFFDGALVVNLALFHNEIEGYQLTQPVEVINPPAAPQQVTAINNAGDVRIHGFEFELTARPTPELTLTANYAYANSRFRRGSDENQGVLNDVADDGLVNCSTGDQLPNISGCQSLFGDITGKSLPRAPEHTVFVDVDYRRDLGNSDWEIFAGINAYLLSSSFAQVHNLAETGDSVVSDVRLGAQNDTFRLQFYVRNLFDETAVNQLIRYADANRDLRRNFIAGLRPPRRFGVIAEVRF
ncbi:TonB-dependent receptor [Erythrobacter sp. BLCC-B19]|uniref:TonB-dependent receptor n=1 Tax=Erythrobacter sp. BLCC-B19 TaxID=3025315 RepID=UPI00235E91EF|nr:TonB-dependent receptor [Erythrobacter sp. BLCC-B19]WDA41354.1 TonB-dependent receptor [Erythrobacter sp. BLCC-B19]